MIGKKIMAGTDIIDSSNHFPIIGAQLCNSEVSSTGTLPKTIYDLLK
jgi:hypothetical protein